jgi:hypothetical protein
MTITHGFIDATCGPAVARRCWRVNVDRRDIPNQCEWWLWLAAAVASWPGPLLSIERRFSTPAADGPVVEHLIASATGAELYTAGAELLGDLGTLFDAIPGLDLVPEPCDALDHWQARSTALHELRLPYVGTVRSHVAGHALSRAIRSLPRDGRSSSVGLFIGSPPMLRHRDESGSSPAGDAVRFRMRLASEGPPRLVTLALLGTALGAAGDAWISPRTEEARRVAAQAHASSTTSPWEPDGSLTDSRDEVLVAPATAAEIVSIPLHV